MRDRLPLGVALLALVVAVVALIMATDDSGDDGRGDDETAIAPIAATVPVATAPPPIPSTTIGTVQTVPTPSTTTATQQVVTATTAAESDDMSSDDAQDRVVLSVVGIGHDSTLNVRETPGGQIIGKLDSLSTGLVPTGTTQELSGVTWQEVHAAGVVGWVSSEYVAPLGVTVEAQSRVVDLLGKTPSAENMTALGRIVAGLVASEEPASRIRISSAPTVGEITMDVVGLADDSIRGLRLQLVGSPGDSGEGLVLSSVQSTVMCFIERGVSAEGSCN